jgi:cytochrome c oxidase subunit 4
MEEDLPIEKHKHPKYLLVFLALAIMTMMELGVYYLPSYLHPVLLLTLSFIKALLVILYFMHLKTDSRWFAFIFLVPFLLVFPMVLVLRLN